MKKIDNVSVDIQGGQMDEKEIKSYIQYLKDKFKDETLTSLTLEIDGDYVNMHYHLQPIPIQRIRRITGYLVGTLERFNDAKKAEEKDRIKHNLS